MTVSKRRKVGSTDLNAVSSRSHAILKVTIETKSGTKIRASNLQIVDLAGSERMDRTGATGERMGEGIDINTSLTALGHVIDQLVKGVPNPNFRDSSLTQLLKSSLAGNSMTIMIANVSPAGTNILESLSTVRFANEAKKIKNKVFQNVLDAAAAKELKSILAEKEAALEEALKQIENLKPLVMTEAERSATIESLRKEFEEAAAAERKDDIQRALNAEEKAADLERQVEELLERNAELAKYKKDRTENAVSYCELEKLLAESKAALVKALLDRKSSFGPVYPMPPDPSPTDPPDDVVIEGKIEKLVTVDSRLAKIIDTWRSSVYTSVSLKNIGKQYASTASEDLILEQKLERLAQQRRDCTPEQLRIKIQAQRVLRKIENEKALLEINEAREAMKDALGRQDASQSLPILSEGRRMADKLTAASDGGENISKEQVELMAPTETLHDVMEAAVTREGTAEPSAESVSTLTKFREAFQKIVKKIVAVNRFHK